MADVYAVPTDTKMRRAYFAQLDDTSEQTDELEEWVTTKYSHNIEKQTRSQQTKPKTRNHTKNELS